MAGVLQDSTFGPQNNSEHTHFIGEEAAVQRDKDFTEVPWLVPAGSGPRSPDPRATAVLIKPVWLWGSLVQAYHIVWVTIYTSACQMHGLWELTSGLVITSSVTSRQDT